ncbi:DUF3307 domain-containing protein [Streptomyces sp. NPDC058240]|uniref:DUF3307 domain-containing protein n=1 Tax=Streptomyces sp. NPDC058240 TaxID=3346396 RepID=UPI0036E65534
MFPTLFVLLYVAHLLSDYPFQPDRQASRKAGWTEGDKDPNPGRHHHGWGANLAHAGTHVLVSAIALALGVLVLDLHLAIPAAAVALLWIGSTHSAIDRRWMVLRWMERTGQPEFVEHGGAAHVDQTAHITALLIAALALAA